MAVFLVSCVDDSGKATEVYEGDETPRERVFGKGPQSFRTVGRGIAVGIKFVATPDALVVDPML